MATAPDRLASDPEALADSAGPHANEQSPPADAPAVATGDPAPARTGSASPSQGAPAAAPRTCIAVIDLGSNAIRLQVARVFEDGTFKVIHDEREPVRLGEEVFRTGQLAPVAIERALATLKRVVAMGRAQGAESIRAVATSAVREASNGVAFLDEVERATGLRPEIITGEQEALLIARGVLASFGPPRGRAALVDVGGGSTEITVLDGERILFSASIPLGSVRLTELFCRVDPLPSRDERRLRWHIRQRLRADLDRRRVPPCRFVIGSAGTIGALANYIRQCPTRPRSMQRSSSFSVSELAAASATLRGMCMEARRATRGIEERRCEIIVAGAVLLEEICAHLRARSVKLVRRGLRDGLMLEQIERLGLQPASRFPFRAPAASPPAAEAPKPPPREVA